MLEKLELKDSVKLFLKNELKQNKKFGTYLFYGDKGIDILKIAKSFAMAINCSELENDFCGVCHVCRKISEENYADLEIIGLSEGETKLGINKIRDTIYKASSSSYEGRKKVFIIKDIESMNKYSANALLKIIEEPPKGTFFMLISNSLNILSTILSRSIIVKIPRLSYEELGVSKEVYEFFDGNMKDLISYREENIELEEIKPYNKLESYLEKYLIEENLKNKVDLLKGVDDYLYSIRNDYIKKSDRIKIAYSIQRVLSNDKIVETKAKERKILDFIMQIFIIRSKLPEKTEKLLEIKQNLKNNVSIQSSLIMFFLKL